MNRILKVSLSCALAVTAVTVLDVAQATYYNRDAFFTGNGLPDASIAALVYWESDGISTYGYYDHSLAARQEFDKVESAVINFRHATSTELNTAQLRYWAKDYGDTYWYGRMTPYDIGGYELTEEGTAWSKTDVQYNDGKMDRHNFVSNERRKVAVHELGHVMSMRHQTVGASSVMQDDRNTYWYLTPTDISNLQFMY